MNSLRDTHAAGGAPRNASRGSKRTLIVLLIWLANSSLAADSIDAEYPHTTKNQKEFVAAVEIADRVLSPASQFRLKEVRSYDQALQPKEIPVKLAEFPPTTTLCLALVPHNKRIIMVEGKEIGKLARLFAGSDDDYHLEPGALLAICILHEVGHIAASDYTNELPAVAAPIYPIDPKLTNFVKSIAHTAYNLLNTAQKDIEEKADLFAALQVRQALAVTNCYNCRESAYFSQNAVSQVCFSFLGRRIKSNFGAVQLGSPRELADSEFYHPNLQYRFLRMQYFISPTETTKASLDYFLEGRRRVTFGPNVIYQKSPATNEVGSGGIKN